MVDEFNKYRSECWMKMIFWGSFLCVVLSLAVCRGDDIKESTIATEIETTRATSYSVPKTTRSYDNSYKKKGKQ